MGGGGERPPSRVAGAGISSTLKPSGSVKVTALDLRPSVPASAGGSWMACGAPSLLEDKDGMFSSSEMVGKVCAAARAREVGETMSPAGDAAKSGDLAGLSTVSQY